MTPARAKDVDPNGEFLRATRETQGTEPDAIPRRLDQIEQALKFDPCHEHRRELVREYLALTEPKAIDHVA